MKWHRYNNKGIKFVINCEIDKHPEPLEEEGYSVWRRGNGPEITIVPKKKKIKKNWKKKAKPQINSC